VRKGRFKELLLCEGRNPYDYSIFCAENANMKIKMMKIC